MSSFPVASPADETESVLARYGAPPSRARSLLGHSGGEGEVIARGGPCSGVAMLGQHIMVSTNRLGEPVVEWANGSATYHYLLVAREGDSPEACRMRTYIEALRPGDLIFALSPEFKSGAPELLYRDRDVLMHSAAASSDPVMQNLWQLNECLLRKEAMVQALDQKARHHATVDAVWKEFHFVGANCDGVCV